MDSVQCSFPDEVVIAVERHRRLLASYVPIKRRPSEDERRAYLAKAGAMLARLRAECGLTDDEFAAAWDAMASDDPHRREG